MDFDHSEGQAVLLAALDGLAAKHRDIGADQRVAFHVYAEALDAGLVENGFLDAARTEGMGPLDAALIVERIARLPQVVEVATSALVAPLLGLDLPRPFAILTAPLERAHRFLPQAQTGILERDGEVLAVPIDPRQVEAVETIYAYPYGRFRETPDLANAQRLDAGAAAALRQWGRVALAAEMSGAIRAATDFTVNYVKERRMFGRQLGSYQSVQHRLSECDQIARATYWLTMKAAWTADPFDAALAASYAQQHVRKVMFDLHQFNGAMGLTKEHLLHFWTFRIRALQAEMGGKDAAACDAATLLWGAA